MTAEMMPAGPSTRLPPTTTHPEPARRHVSDPTERIKREWERADYQRFLHDVRHGPGCQCPTRLGATT